MTTKKITNTSTTSVYEDPKVLFNTLIKMPGVELTNKTIIDFVDLYMNSMINVENAQGKNELKELIFHLNFVILGGPLYETTVDKVALSIDKTSLNTEDFCKTLGKIRNLDYISKSLLMISFTTSYHLSGFPTGGTKHYSPPYAINCEIPKSNYSYSTSAIIPHCESYSNISYEAGNMIIGFTGESAIDFSSILDPQKKLAGNFQINDAFGVAKYMISSNLVKQTSIYGDAYNIGHLLENYIKPKFLKSNFEFAVLQQDSIEQVYFSKGCKEISKGIWITNPFGHTLMQNKDLVIPNSTSTKLRLEKSIETHLKNPPAVRALANAEPRVIQHSATPAKQTQLVPSELFNNSDLTNEETLEELRKRNQLKVNPAIIHVCSAILGKDYVTSDLKNIPKGSKVKISQTTVNSLSIENPYMCSIINANNKHTYTEVLSADKINEYMILIPEQKFSTLLTNFSGMLKELYTDNGAFMEDLLQLKEILISGNNSHTLDQLIKNNYAIDQIKVNGYRRYSWQIRAMILTLIDHVYYRKTDYTKFNMLGALPITTYLKVFIQTVEEVKSKSNPEVITNIKLGLLTTPISNFD